MKANHNKDYSVVKTFGLPLVHNQEAFLLPNCFMNNEHQSIKNHLSQTFKAGQLAFFYCWRV
jgi:hypothetical protein